MEFNKRLQELRKQKGLTQEALAEKLHVSRTAISKWESGRGYPSIDSLKAIAGFFSITVDELLSSDEILKIAEGRQKQTVKHFRDLIFGILDVFASLLIFLPLFASRNGETVESVSLLTLSIWPPLRVTYFVVVAALTITGIATLALQECASSIWLKAKAPLSLAISAVSVMLFMLGLHPYAATLAFALLIAKTLSLKNK